MIKPNKQNFHKKLSFVIMSITGDRFLQTLARASQHIFHIIQKYMFNKLLEKSTENNTSKLIFIHTDVTDIILVKQSLLIANY